MKKQIITFVKKNFVTFIFLAPAMTLLFVFKIYPILISFIGSMFTDSFISGGKVFVGFENYMNLFKDKAFYQSLKATFYFNVITTPLQLFLALVLSLLVKRRSNVIGAFRSIFLMPMAIAMAVGCLIWNIILNPNQGIVNSMLNSIGILSQPFFTSARQAMVGVIIICVWKGVGYWMMFLLSGIQGIPEQIYEAAKIDGANSLRMVWNITLPLLRRALAFVFVSDTVSNLLMFAPMYMLTSGGPEMSTNLLMYEAFKSGFIYVDLGRSYSIVTILILITFSIVLLEMKLLSPKH